MNANLESFGERLKALRIERNLSQGDVASTGGFTQAQVSFWETGRALPGLESTVKLAQVFGTTVQDLLLESHPRMAPPRPPNRIERAIWVLEAMQFTRPAIDRVKLVLHGEKQ